MEHSIPTESQTTAVPRSTIERFTKPRSTAVRSHRNPALPLGPSPVCVSLSPHLPVDNAEQPRRQLRHASRLVHEVVQQAAPAPGQLARGLQGLLAAGTRNRGNVPVGGVVSCQPPPAARLAEHVGDKLDLEHMTARYGLVAPWGAGWGERATAAWLIPTVGGVATASRMSNANGMRGG